MDEMVDPFRCAEIVQGGRTNEEEPVWAVIGGSHSAMLIVMNLIEAGASKIINFYRSDLRFMHVTEDGWLRCALFTVILSIH